MKHHRMRSYLLGGLLLLFSLILVACSQDGETVEVTRIVEVTVEVPGETITEEVEVTRVVEVAPEVPAGPSVPYEEQWASSAHADASAVAFTDWNEEDPAEIPDRCAKCHSTPGFQDFLGADGSEAGVVNAPAPIGTTVECVACHNEAAAHLDSAVFPSGAVLTGLGPEARCIQCHQGRASTVQVNDSIATAGLTEADEDVVSEDLGFTNIHYFAAAATQYGTSVMGGYEYVGNAYDARFDHVEPYNTCVDCHDPHTLEVKLDECVVCHEGVEDAEDLVDIRMVGSLVDYNGNGDMEEGIYFEIEGLRTMLYQAMQTYATEVAGTGIAYSEQTYPYFFIDTNGDGITDEAEANGDNRYNAWTPRLAKAAYNYQVSLKDPGRFAHGGKYIIQLLYDSIENLNAGMTTPVDLTNANRLDRGHFAASEEAFRHWDGEEEGGGVVPGTCSRCHSAAGLPLFVTQGVAINQPASGGLNCATCHNDLTTFTRYEVATVPFPSGVRLTNPEDDLDSNLCISCHQGRESTISVNRLIGELADDEVSENLRFLNVHYFAAGATLFGTEAKGAYEYEGQTYFGRNEHVGAFNSCNECHDTHALEVQVEECADCHESVSSAEDLVNIRFEENTVDYDGDGDNTEGIALEIETMKEQLYAAMQAYATETAGTGILYSPTAYPYYFADANGNGVADPEEINNDGRYNTWTPRLLRAAYNYQYVTKDTGAFAHNGLYVLQLLYDGLTDLSADTSAMTRPVVPAPAAE